MHTPQPGPRPWHAGRLRLIVLLSVATHVMVMAQDLPVAARASAEISSRQMDPDAGLVTDATVTFIGQAFYRSFMSTWRELPMSERYSLSIIERPSARWGSLIRVETAAGRLVFTTFLSPGRRDLISPSAEEAARITHHNVVEADLQRLLFKDEDLAPDEL